MSSARIEVDGYTEYIGGRSEDGQRDFPRAFSLQLGEEFLRADLRFRHFNNGRGRVVGVFVKPSSQAAVEAFRQIDEVREGEAVEYFGSQSEEESRGGPIALVDHNAGKRVEVRVRYFDSLLEQYINN